MNPVEPVTCTQCGTSVSRDSMGQPMPCYACWFANPQPTQPLETQLAERAGQLAGLSLRVSELTALLERACDALHWCADNAELLDVPLLAELDAAIGRSSTPAATQQYPRLVDRDMPPIDQIPKQGSFGLIFNDPRTIDGFDAAVVGYYSENLQLVVVLCFASVTIGGNWARSGHKNPATSTAALTAEVQRRMRAMQHGYDTTGSSDWTHGQWRTPREQQRIILALPSGSSLGDAVRAVVAEADGWFSELERLVATDVLADESP